jgi:hypothetical protein
MDLRYIANEAPLVWCQDALVYWRVIMTLMFRDYGVSLGEAWKAAGLTFVEDVDVVDRQGRTLPLMIGVKMLHVGADKVRRKRGDYESEGIPIIQL